MRKDIHAYYLALGLNPGAGPADIRRAYRQLVQQWHPDLFKPGSPMQTTAEDITKEINEAYEQLYRKGLHRKFRPKAAQGPDPAGNPEGPTKEDAGAQSERPTQPSPPDAQRPARKRPSFAKPPGRPKKSVSFHRRRNRRRPWYTPWSGFALIVALIIAALPAGKKIWGSFSETPAQTAEIARVDPKPVANVRARPEALVPERLWRSESSEETAGRPALNRGRVQADGLQSDAGRDQVADRSDCATRFERAEALLDVFEVGDPKAKVLAVQGSPDDTGEAVLRYGSSLVYLENGRVRDWSDGWPRLRVRAWPTFSGPSLDTFSVGSTRADVVRAQGAPAAFTLQSYFYGSSAVYFEDDRVTGWDEGDVGLNDTRIPTLPFVDLDRLELR